MQSSDIPSQNGDLARHQECPSRSVDFQTPQSEAVLRSEIAGLTDECRRLAAENDVWRQRVDELQVRYQTMVEGAIQGIVIHQDGLICYANSAALRILDYANPDELLGQDIFTTLVAADERSAIRTRTDSLYRGVVRPSLATWRAIARHGSEVLVTTTASLIAWNGRPAVVVFFQDITEERRAVEALREREALLRSITDHTDDVIFVKDRDSRVLFMNLAGFRVNGLSPQQVLGHTDAEFLSDADLAAAFRTADVRVMESRRSETIEEEFPSADGQRRRFLTRKTPRLDADGDVIGIVGVIRDITEERQLQREILDIAADENRRIGQDLHDGAGQRLTGLAYMAESLRNQLRDKSLPESELAERVVRTVKSVQMLIRGYSRGLIPVDVDAEGLRFALEHLADSTESASGIPCTFECPLPVRIENNHVATHLYRIAQEAVTNALRYANAQLIEVELTADHSELRLSIRDNGIGLPAEKSTEGFGLRIMKYRAGLMGGSLSIHTEPTQGTKVTCTLPFNELAD